MRLIAHRGNTNGPNPLKENHPDYIDETISKGYDVEIDIRYSPLADKLYLGHDISTYEITLQWLDERIDKLWIHCKNIDALEYFISKTNRYNYFWHQEDDYTLTSKRYIWTYPGKTYTPKSVIVMPEWNSETKLEDLKTLSCFGICSDYILKIKTIDK